MHLLYALSVNLSYMIDTPLHMYTTAYKTHNFGTCRAYPAIEWQNYLKPEGEPWIERWRLSTPRPAAWVENTTLGKVREEKNKCIYSIQCILYIHLFVSAANVRVYYTRTLATLTKEIV